MQFESFAEFINMGGHGLYVWLAYGASVLVVLGYAIAIKAGRRRVLRELRWQAQVTDKLAVNDAAGDRQHG